MTSSDHDAATGDPAARDDAPPPPAPTTPSMVDAPADVADVAGADTSVTRGSGAEVGARSREDGDASQVAGIVVDDLNDVEQVSVIPPMPGLSFRGRGADWWEVGRSYVEPGWLRSSRDPLVGSGNFADGAVVALFGPLGRDVAPLSGHPEEQETVFLPGSRFTVVRQGQFVGLWVTVVHVHRDDEPAPDDQDQVTRAASVLGRARTLPPATLARPARFSGEFGTRR